jgi:hypothetical protein
VRQAASLRYEKKLVKCFAPDHISEQALAPFESSRLELKCAPVTSAARVLVQAENRFQ